MADTKSLDQTKGNQFNTDDLMSVLLSLKSNTMRAIHVASLGVATAIRDANAHEITETAFPKLAGQPEGSLTAYCFTTAIYEDLVTKIGEEKKGCVVLLLFLDQDSEANMSYILSSKQIKAYSSSATLHSANNAIIIAVGDPLDATTTKET